MKDVKCSVLRLRGFRASPFSLPVNSRNRILSIHAETFTQTYNACNSLLIDFFCRLSVTYLQSSSTHEWTHSLSNVLTRVLLCDDCRSTWQIILHSSSLLISHDACVSSGCVHGCEPGVKKLGRTLPVLARMSVVNFFHSQLVLLPCLCTCYV